MTEWMPLLAAVDLLATVVFAVSGALVASRKRMDLIGFVWLGVLTGVGGGTVRDLLLGVPVFWVVDPTPVLACTLAAVAVYFTAHLVESRYKVLLWFDAAGLALFSVAGAAKGLDAGTGPLVAAAMGVVTATVGGIVRDVLGQEPSAVLRREVYVSAAAVGGGVHVAVFGLTGHELAAALTGLSAAFALRALAILRGWALPRFKPRAGRSLEAIADLERSKRPSTR